MNNNKIKILSIMVLLLFASSFAMPFFAQENCEMPEATNSVLHCDMTKADMDCCKAVTECVTVLFNPITTAPINKIEVQKNLTVNNIVSFSHNILLVEEIQFSQVNYESSCPEIHPGFQTPLLV